MEAKAESATRREVGRQRTEKPDERGRLLLQAKVPLEIVFKTKDLAHAHGITIEATVTWALRSLLTRAGIEVKPERGTKSADE